MAEIEKLFTERYRWKSLEHMQLPKRVKDELKNGLVTNIFLYGPAGTGKTTIAKILTADIETMELNGSSENGIDIIRNKVVSFASTISLLQGNEKMKCVFIDEADGLTDAAWDALRETIEHYASNVRFVCTCNKIDKIPSPIKSRFNCVALYPINKDEETEVFAGYMNLVASLLRINKITYTNDNLAAFIKNSFPDMRTILTTIQSLTLQGVTELNVDSIAKTFECSDLFELIMTGNDPVANYVTIATNYSNMVDDAMLCISKNFINYLREKYPQYCALIPYFITEIATYMNMLPTASDKLLVLLACCFKLQIIRSQVKIQ